MLQGTLRSGRAPLDGSPRFFIRPAQPCRKPYEMGGGRASARRRVYFPDGCRIYCLRFLRSALQDDPLDRGAVRGLWAFRINPSEIAGGVEAISPLSALRV